MQTNNPPLVVLDCASCAIEFGITRKLFDRRKTDGRGFMCPNGHSNVFKNPTDPQEGDKDGEDDDTPEDKPEDVPADAPPAEDSKFNFEPIKIH